MGHRFSTNIDKYSILAISVIVIIFFGYVLFSDQMFVYRDFHRYFYPIRQFASEAIKGGILPLWNPYLYCGMPFLAEPQTAIFYPLSLITYIFPFDLGIKLFIILHYFLSGFFLYLFMRDLKCSPIASLLSACTYTFGGYLISAVDMLTTLSAATWIPAVFLYLNQAINLIILPDSKKRKLFWYICGIAIFLSLEFLGGEPFVLYSTVMVMILFTFVRIIHIRFLQKNGLPVFRVLSLLAGAGIIGCGLSAIQLLPFYELIQYSSRYGGIELYEASAASLAPYELISLITPLFFGNFGQHCAFWLGQSWLKTGYIGVISAIFMTIAFFCQKRRLVVFWYGIFVLGIALSLGGYMPWYSWCYEHLPFFNLMRFPIKFFCLSAFAAAIVTGLGCDWICQNLKNKRLNLLHWLTITILTITILWLFIRINQEIVVSWINKVYFSQIPYVRVKEFLTCFNLGHSIVFASIMLILLYLGRYNILQIKILKGGLLLVLVVDLFIVGFRLNPTVEGRFYHHSPSVIDRIPQGLDRVIIHPSTERYLWKLRGITPLNDMRESMELLGHNATLPYRIFNVGGYGSVELDRYIQAKNLFKEDIPPLNLLRLFNIGYIILRGKEGTEVYENIKPLPRVFWVENVCVINNSQKLLHRLKDPQFDPENEVILETAPTVAKSRSQKSKVRGQGLVKTQQHIEIVEYQLNKVTIKVSSHQDGFLVLSDTYYPGWQAYIDGQKSQIYRANYTFRAIALPVGKHDIVFVYRPFCFILGSVITITTIFCIISGYSWFFSRRKKSGNSSDPP